MWIQDVVQEIRDIKSCTLAEFDGLSEEQLLWKPAPGSWSIAECLQHIVIANSLYLQDINQKLAKAEVRTVEYPVRLSWMGRIFLLFVDPRYKWKVPAPKMFKPIKNHRVTEGSEVLKNYILLQDKLITAAEKAIGYDHANIYTRSPLSRFLKFNIGEQFYIMMRHERRHLNQARKVKKQLLSNKKAA